MLFSSSVPFFLSLSLLPPQLSLPTFLSISLAPSLFLSVSLYLSLSFSPHLCPPSLSCLSFFVPHHLSPSLPPLSPSLILPPSSSPSHSPPRANAQNVHVQAQEFRRSDNWITFHWILLARALLHPEFAAAGIEQGKRLWACWGQTLPSVQPPSRSGDSELLPTQATAAAPEILDSATDTGIAHGANDPHHI